MALLHNLPTDNAQTPVANSPSNPIWTAPASLASGAANGTAFAASVTIARPANTTAYTANDVIGIDAAGSAGVAALQFTNMGRTDGNILITRAVLEIDDTALISGEGSYDLHLYTVTPPSALLDNAAFDLPSGDRASYHGKITIGTPVDLGSTLYVELDSVNKHLKMTGTDLFGYLVTSGAYTPTSGRTYKVKLRAISL